MKKRSLEFIAYQLSKITTNLKYNFEDAYYVKDPNVLHVPRDLHYFFEDAYQYTQICDLPFLDHKEFILTFKSTEIRNMAIPILKSHDFLWEEEPYEVDSCKIYVHSYDQTAYDFIFGKSRSRISINQLSIILNTEIDFEYSYPELWPGKSNLKFGKCHANKGVIDFDCEMTFKELKNLKDIYAFNESLFIFFDLVDDLKIAKTINLKIIKE